jgi:AraC-like DNA-binding protein
LVRGSLAEFRRATGLAAKLVPAVLPTRVIRFGAQETDFWRRWCATRTAAGAVTRSNWRCCAGWAVNSSRIRSPAGAGQPIGRIAADAGFQSASDFKRIFKARVGMTPTDFRRKGV